jgi:hypothetical protein
VKAAVLLTNCAVAAVAAAVAMLVFAAPVTPATGPYTIEGGTPTQRAQVRRALAASAFDWNLVRAVVKVRITRDPATWARPGQIILSADLLDTGRSSWGIVQHEFAHQVDFFLLDEVDRLQLARFLGGMTWWPSRAPGLGHRAYACERFASMLAWAYWPSRQNALRPRSRSDESAAMEPARFRALLAEVLGNESLARPVRSTP